VTDGAVRDFQSSNGLKVDGAVTQRVWEALFIDAQQGDQGDPVSALQTLLNAQGSDIPVDGDFGEVTDGAVRDFQSSNGLPVDGVVNQQTWSALVSR